MNIALFASAYHPHLGGVEEACRQLAAEYRRRGVGVVVVTDRWPRSLEKFEEVEGVPVYRPPLRAPEPSAKARLTYRLTHRAIRREVAGVLRRHRVDLVHVQCVSSNGHYGRLAAVDLGVPLVVTAQGERTMDATGLYERSAFANATLRALLDEADHVTACSRHTLDDLEQYWGWPLGERGSVVHNGIRLADFDCVEPHRHDRPYALAIGRHVPQKGFDVLLRAWASAESDGRTAGHDLLIAGDGPERASLERLGGELGESSRVRFVGRADRPAAVALFKGCSFFVLPSRMEPQGIVNLEAMAAGKAVVASDVGGVPEIVLDGETGLLSPGGDADALAERIGRLAGDATLRERLGRAGRRRAEEFDWGVLANQYLNLYRDGSALTVRPAEGTGGGQRPLPNIAEALDS